MISYLSGDLQLYDLKFPNEVKMEKIDAADEN